MTLLTVGLVEELQQAIELGRPVDGVVGRLQGTTLPALLEYGCLRWAREGDVPQLPPTLTGSPVGRALQEVRSELGLRFTGPPKPRLRRLDVQSAEFHVIAGEADLLDDEWNHFLTRFDRSAQDVGFPRRRAHLLQAAFNEMANNAVSHSGTPVSSLVGYAVEPEMAVFSVVDVGIGVLASLRSNPRYSGLRLQNDAIRNALQDGTTRHADTPRGLGFRQVFKSIVSHWGYLRFRSGNGCATMTGDDLDADRGTASFPPAMPGFQVTICCRTTPPGDSSPPA